MTIFFFSVGLEIKRETLVGELSSFRQALLPIVAACGGMIVPVIIYYCMTSGRMPRVVWLFRWQRILLSPWGY